MAEIVMPRLSDSMEEGTILQWLKQVGEEVAVGDELVEIETQRAPAQTVQRSHVDEGLGVGRVTAADGQLSQLVHADRPPVVPEHHREARRSALRGCELLDVRDRPPAAGHAELGQRGKALEQLPEGGDRLHRRPSLINRMPGTRALTIRSDRTRARATPYMPS